MNKLLIVDDENDILSVLEIGLQKAGFDITSFSDPIQALSDFRSEVYDLSLLDIKMPEINGFELYRRLKSIDRDVKVCFFTAFEMPMEEFEKQFPDVGMHCLIKKPVEIPVHVN
jgi:two-component system catabolic regulation response regulator CreB/two-component system response regulator ChvI